MNISILENGKEIRQAFIKKFTVTSEKLYLWEAMECRAISFSKAIEFLRSMQGEVLFMSENENKPYCRGIEVDGVEYKGVVAKMDAAALAQLIEYEWNEGWRLSALDMYLDQTVLPVDLYVFDASMEHMLVFTHENDYWELELEQPMKCAASRFCMMYGFELPEAVAYESIRTMLEAELAPNSSLEIEISYSHSMCFRQFVISKWTNDDNTGYQYWFDFDSNTVYATWGEAESAKVFNGLSLKEVSEHKGVRFDIVAIDGN